MGPRCGGECFGAGPFVIDKKDSGGGGQEKRGIGAARNADKFVEPSLGRGPQGAKGGRRAKGHLTRGGAASSAKFNQLNEIEHRWVQGD